MDGIRCSIIRSLLLCLFASLASCDQSAIRMNEVQVIGSHNSYKIAIEPALLAYIGEQNPDWANSLEYSHPTLTKQLDLGLRNLEIDVLYDPEGGYHANPLGLNIVRQLGIEPLPFDEDKKLSQPGLKVFHIQDVDFRSHNLLFSETLTLLKHWSDAHPDHLPITILINAKDSSSDFGRKPLVFSKEALGTIDEEIFSYLGTEEIITPDDVRGEYNTLEQAVLDGGWPTLEESRGKFLFVLDEREPKRDRYIDGHPSLRERAMFTNSAEGRPESAFRVINNPVRDLAEIKRLVAAGYMVRTRADANTVEARENNYERFEKAVESGAQVISTDYYIPSMHFASDFQIIFDDGRYERVGSDIR